ncbi:MAG: metalloregulator ArsR/SmtB family transcription factor [Bacillota bacterium]|nr:metalloregulator ArsR/SmtB family transcription factor [Bacillota bacterium]MDD3298621.1 metalloregulator ArsR/SmtB family transcription factor [Bacillota bacterium]MDD3851122.1 metalloregulator ArsR/SmtB family transcription factor [Bacillota bacterium]MDD4707572.1 metalloregulator ArsR/SmtB family transcription factor [Bacillota bacterium]
MYKDNIQLYRYRAEVLKSLSHPVRLAIVDYLTDSEKCVCDIVDYLEEKQSSVSRHLAILRGSGIVETRKEGLQVYYSLNTPCVNVFLNCVDRIIKERHEEKSKVLDNM